MWAQYQWAERVYSLQSIVKSEKQITLDSELLTVDLALNFVFIMPSFATLLTAVPY